jgi:multidrug efflux pump subunit AcrB
MTGGASISVSGFGPGFSTSGASYFQYNVKLTGYNYERVKSIASSYREWIERDPRINSVDINRSFGRYDKSYEFVLRLDRDLIAKRGLTISEVIKAISMYTRGVIEKNYFETDNDRIAYVTKFQGHQDFSVDDLKSKIIVNHSGARIRLSDICFFELMPVPGEITRENQQYVRWIGFKFQGPEKAGNAFLKRSLQSINLPDGYHIFSETGYFRFSPEHEVHFLWIALIALLIVFMITSGLYESLVRPFIVILAVPFCLIGLFMAYYLTGVPFGRGGYAAIVLLIGIAASNSIILVDYIFRMMKEHGRTVESVVYGASARFRAVIATSMSTTMGLLPFLMIGKTTGIWHNLAVGTIGGLLTSTFLTLLVVPAACIRMGQRPQSGMNEIARLSAKY